jgi:hypothetical protein
MVDEVVACECVDERPVAAPVRDGDRDELAVARGARRRLRAHEQCVRVAREQRRGDEDPRVVAGLGGRDDRRDRVVVAEDEPAEQWVHGTSLPGAADTALTPPYDRAVYEISVLGPVEVRRDGEPVAVPGGKTAELLVRLALEAGTFVRAERLVDDLWGGAATSRNTLQQKVARLRRALPDPALLEQGEGAYRLAVEANAVDALRVLGAPADAGDPGAAASALECVRGDLLPAAGDWATPYRAPLQEAQL